MILNLQGLYDARIPAFHDAKEPRIPEFHDSKDSKIPGLNNSQGSMVPKNWTPTIPTLPKIQMPEVQDLMDHKLEGSHDSKFLVLLGFPQIP